MSFVVGYRLLTIIFHVWWIDRVGQVLENYNALGMQFFSSFMVRSYQMKP